MRPWWWVSEIVIFVMSYECCSPNHPWSLTSRLQTMQDSTGFHWIWQCIDLKLWMMMHVIVHGTARWHPKTWNKIMSFTNLPGHIQLQSAASRLFRMSSMQTCLGSKTTCNTLSFMKLWLKTLMNFQLKHEHWFSEAFLHPEPPNTNCFNIGFCLIWIET